MSKGWFFNHKETVASKPIQLGADMVGHSISDTVGFIVTHAAGPMERFSIDLLADRFCFFIRTVGFYTTNNH